MKAVVRQRLKELFSSGGSVELKKVSLITGTFGVQIYIEILNFINDSLDNLNYESNFSYILNALSYLDKSVTKYSDVNMKNFVPKIVELYDKLSIKLLEHKSEISAKQKEELDSISDKIRSYGVGMKNNNSKRYDFLFGLITKMENHNMRLMMEIINEFNMSAKDKNGQSLLIGVLNYYLDLLNDTKLNISKVHYYNNMLKLLVNKRHNGISSKEKSSCLELIYRFLERLSIKDKNYSFKKDQCLSLISFLKNELVEKNLLHDLGRAYNISIDFHNSSIDTISSKKNNVGSSFNRNQVNDCIISIDRGGTKEIDDALSCKQLPTGNYLLGVHIVDVLAYVPYSSYVIREAIERGSTIYLSDRRVSMFPEELIMEATFSKGKSRFANSYFFEISDSGIVNTRIEKTVIQNAAQLSYNKVNQILKSGSVNNYSFGKTLLNLCNVSEIISRMYKGQLPDFVLQDYEPNISAKNLSEKIVSNAMILTNNTVANLFYERGYPFIYRNHKLNVEKMKMIMDQFQQLNQDCISNDVERIFTIIKNHCLKVEYGMEGGHDGLNLDHYTNVTSPLRRAADVVAAHFINRCYFEYPVSEDLNNLKLELEEVIPNLNNTNNLIEMFICDYESTKKNHRKVKSL